MTASKVLAFWRGKLRDFGPAQGGNIALTFAAFSLPLVMFTGWAIDYSRGNSAQTSMHAALDATGLALSKEAHLLNQTQLNEKADKYFRANFNRPEAKSIKIEPVYTALADGKFQLQLHVSATIPTTIAAIWQEHMSIAADTRVVWGYKKLELALALDNTGSMSSKNKMTQLKIAAKNLISILQEAAKSMKAGDVKISIVPFGTDVNIGTANVNANWLRWNEWESDSKNYSCSRTKYTSKKDCENNNGTWSLKARSTWNGCIWDRNQDHDVKNTAPNPNVSATLFSPHQTTTCPVAMMPLSHDWNALNSKIDSMTPTGNTNVTIGLALGWQTLSPVAPYNAATPSVDIDKVVILLTDGNNTQNRFSTSTSTIDKRTEKACDNAKADGIKIYTIRVIDGNASLLRKCATTPAMYFDVQDASELNTVFTTIGNSLANLRLAQ